jgi:hypothetical protein
VVCFVFCLFVVVSGCYTMRLLLGCLVGCFFVSVCVLVAVWLLLLMGVTS